MKIAVTSKSFSKNTVLVTALKREFSDIRLNNTGRELNEDELVRFFEGCSGAIVALEKINQQVLAQCSSLKVVSKYGVGLDNIDFSACEKNEVAVSFQAGVNKTSVAELTLTFMLMALRNVAQTSLDLRNGHWNKNGGVSLYKKTVGIIGFGHIGQELARILQPFGCKLLAYDILDKKTEAEGLGVELVELEQLLKLADIVTLHVPKTPVTTEMINIEQLQKMTPSAILVNTARGGLINENALLSALNNNEIQCAALDVFDYEPLVKKEIYSHPRIICTPHIAGNSAEAVIAMGLSAIEGLVKHLKG